MKWCKVICFVLVSLFLFSACSSKSELSESGNYYNNIKEFYYTLEEENTNELTIEYMKHIEYKIIEFDKEKMVAELEVSVPDITKLMSDTCDKYIRENECKSYEELFTKVKEEIVLGIKDCDKTSEIITVEVYETEEKEYRLVQNDEWYRVTTGKLLDFYTESMRDYIKENTQ